MMLIGREAAAVLLLYGEDATKVAQAIYDHWRHSALLSLFKQDRGRRG